MPLFLSRARLRHDTSMNALAELLVPVELAGRRAASHRLVWSLFADGEDRQRDFLWREEGPGRFMTLSMRPPADPHRLFDLESKTFEPTLSSGDRLGFTLRANPVVARVETPGQRGKRHDVVMDLLRRTAGERKDTRPDAVLSAGRAWLVRQGEVNGFMPVGDVAVDGYDSMELPRAGLPPAVFGVVDISGVLQVVDPARFLPRLSHGFGRARAFGCGLMLIRRAR